MKISIIQPSRNNLRYLQWSYDSIRKHQGNHIVQICVADDFSNDGTWEWCCDVKRRDPEFDCIRNDGPTRVGHTILYDRLVNEISKYDLCMIFHADMYLCPGALDAIEYWMYESETIAARKKRIVSLTRIEPPLHPPGPEKLIMDYGIEPEQFDEDKFLMELNSPSFASFLSRHSEKTEGVFAPWAFWKTDFQEIGGHDPLFAPQSKEDSDIFNRFQLNGVEFVQTWTGFVYHMTCRGSRFNPTITTVGKNSTEWEQQNQRSARNFIRKWGHYVKHDQFMKPIIPHKYDIGIVVRNCNPELLHVVELLATTTYVNDLSMIGAYISKYQSETMYDLHQRLIFDEYDRWYDHDVIIEIDGRTFNQIDMDSLMSVSEILADSGATGKMKLGNMMFHINKLEPKEMELIRVNK